MKENNQNQKDQTKMITLYFTKQFVSEGLLKGIQFKDSLDFVSAERAMVWVEGIKANCKSYKLVNYSFQGRKWGF